MSRREDLAVRFERIAELHGDRLMGYLLRRVTTDDAPDVAAQTLLVAWRRVHVMPTEDEQALWWLLAIARRTVANHRRGLVRKDALADRLRALPMAVTQSVNADLGLAMAEALEALPADDQELVRLIYWDDLSVKAAAAVLDISDAAARKRLQRARERLRDALAMVEVVSH